MIEAIKEALKTGKARSIKSESETYSKAETALAEIEKLHKAALVFAKEWNDWHCTPDVLCSVELVNSMHEIIDVLGFDMVSEDSENYTLVKRGDA